MTATLNINLNKIEHNAKVLIDKLTAKNVSCTFVTKCFCADKRIIQRLNGTACHALADSRIENLKAIATDKQRLLLRLPMLSEVNEVVRYCDVSLNSSIETLDALQKVAAKHNKQHGIILMIDLGDLREGVMYDNLSYVDQFFQTVESSSHLYLEGVGTNLTCYGGVLPDKQNLSRLISIANRYKHLYGKQLSIISGGNSSSLLLLDSAQFPVGINNLRLGESMLLGRETAYGGRIFDTYDDCFTLTAELIEVFSKPSYPIGTATMNAFGEKTKINDKGIMNRAIAAIGRQDTDISGLTPVDGSISVVGGSSDHLILDTGSSPCKVGDKVTFKLNYGALLGCFTSKYVKKKYFE